MPKYALPMQWRNRRAAIGKKGELESEMLMDSELVITAKTKERTVNAVVASPTTIASTFDFNAMPEMQPLPDSLEAAMTPRPGAWMVVGKGGRTLKDAVMYDDPMPRVHKKKRNRVRKAPSDDDSSLLANLVEEPSTSTCEQMMHRSMTRRAKQLGKKMDAKHWAQYRQEKELKVLARDTLIYVLAQGGMLEEVTDEELSAPEPLKKRHDTRSRRGAKVRREKRLASAASRCYSAEEAEWIGTAACVEEPKPSMERRHPVQGRAREVVKQGAPTTNVTSAETERDAWTTVTQSSSRVKTACSLS